MIKMTVLTTRLVEDNEFPEYLQRLAMAGYPEDVLEVLKSDGRVVWLENNVETRIILEEVKSEEPEPSNNTRKPDERP
jgi:hypothetical protein